MAYSTSALISYLRLFEMSVSLRVMRLAALLTLLPIVQRADAMCLTTSASRAEITSLNSVAPGSEASTLNATLANVGELVQTLAKLTQQMVSAMEDFGGALLSSGDVLVRDILHDIRRQLFDGMAELQRLSRDFGQRYDATVTHLNASLMSHSDDIDAWAARIYLELRSVNDTLLYKESCALVDNYVGQLMTQLRNCCNVAVKPVRSMCWSARELIAEAFGVLADILEHMQHCLEDKNSYRNLDYMLPCINVAYDDLSAMFERAARLRHKIKAMLPTKLFSSRCCISVLLVEMEPSQYANDTLPKEPPALSNQSN